MANKTPQRSSDKKVGKSLMEKRNAKRDKKAGKDVIPKSGPAAGTKSGT